MKNEMVEHVPKPYPPKRKHAPPTQAMSICWYLPTRKK